jgi:hypothetical protein
MSKSKRTLPQFPGSVPDYLRPVSKPANADPSPAPENADPSPAPENPSSGEAVPPEPASPRPGEPDRGAPSSHEIVRHVRETPEDRKFKAGEILGKNFRIESVIDSGAVGRVYRATQLSTGRIVALKILLWRHASTKQRKAMLKELKALCTLRHPNIVMLLDAGETEDGLPWFAMEFLEGVTLRQYLRRKRVLDEMEMLSIAIQVARGVAAAHKAKILHRDLKPENIFVSEGGHVTIVDFGTAKILGGDVDKSTGRNLNYGTVGYMAPERLVDDSSTTQDDPRSDLYSLGLIEYEMVAGRNFIVGHQKDLSRQEIMLRQAGTPPKVPAGLSLPTWSLIEPTLNKEPDRRPESVSLHLEALEKLQLRMLAHRNVPAFAMPPQALDGPARWPRVARAIAVGGAAGVLLAAMVVMVLIIALRPAPSEPTLARSPIEPAKAIVDPVAESPGPAPPIAPSVVSDTVVKGPVAVPRPAQSLPQGEARAVAPRPPSASAPKSPTPRARSSERAAPSEISEKSPYASGGLP